MFLHVCVAHGQSRVCSQRATVLDVTKTGKGEQGTENGSLGMSTYSGNPPENSQWWTKEKKREKCQGFKCEFLSAVLPDDQYVLVSQLVPG